MKYTQEVSELIEQIATLKSEFNYLVTTIGGLMNEANLIDEHIKELDFRREELKSQLQESEYELEQMLQK